MLLTRFNYFIPCKLDKFRTHLSIVKNRISNIWGEYEVRSQNFHTNIVCNVKFFSDTENKFAHNILEKYDYRTLFKEPNLAGIQLYDAVSVGQVLSESSPSSSVDELFEKYKFLIKFCNETKTCISNERFIEFIDLFTDQCNKLSDDQLKDCVALLGQLPETEGIRTRNFVELWSTLDIACCERIDLWSIEELLLVCDYWYFINLGKCCEFVWEAIRKIGRKLHRLQPKQLVQTMFYCNLLRKPMVEMFQFEQSLHTNIDALSIEELSVMCMGFFKTQTPIRNNELIEKMYKRFWNELHKIDGVALVNIIKLLRYSTRLPQCDLLEETLEKLCPHIERVSLLSCLHIALAGCDMQLAHQKSLQLIIDRFNREIKEARLKDMERIGLVMGLLSFESESGVEKELCLKILSELKLRVDEIIRYPKCFTACLHYLTLCGFHDSELISAVLDQKFIKRAYGSNMALSREVFSLDSYTRINLKDSYSGNELTEKQRQNVGRLLTHYIPERNTKFKLSLTDNILLDIKDACEELFNVCTIKHVLPHFQRPDILIALDRAKNRGVPLSDSCPPHYIGSVLFRDEILSDPSEDIQSIVIVVGGWNNYVRKSSKPTGTLKLKMDQLKLLGHFPILIPWHEWRELQTVNDRHEYLRRTVTLACNN